MTFIVYCLPRSRSNWLSHFLSYGDCKAYHEQCMYMRSVDDMKSWLAQENTGACETAASPGWRLIHHYRPDIKVVVVRRPVEEVVGSMLKIDLSGIAAYDPEKLRRGMVYLDRCLDQIEQQPGVLSVTFADLAREETCAKVFEHCLPYRHDSEHWKFMSGLNLQVNMRALMRYRMAYRPQIDRLKAECWSEIRRLYNSGAFDTGRRFKLAPKSRALTEIPVFAEEPFVDFFRDGQALFREHFAETGPMDDGMPLNPDAKLGAIMADMGLLRVITARLAGKLIGYLMFIIERNAESREIIQAVQLPFFVTKAYRGLGLQMHRFAVQLLRDLGVKRLVLRAGMRASGPRLAILYKRLGAKEDARMFTLWIGDRI